MAHADGERNRHDGDTLELVSLCNLGSFAPSAEQRFNVKLCGVGVPIPFRSGLPPPHSTPKLGLEWGWCPGTPAFLALGRKKFRWKIGFFPRKKGLHQHDEVWLLFQEAGEKEGTVGLFISS